MSQLDIRKKSCTPTKIRIIGDLHGNTKKYLEIINGCQFSIQLGDFGYDYSVLKNVDWENHKFFCGNHCNHDDAPKWPHWLGKYGELNGDMFFVGGGFSIDQETRKKMHAIGAWPQTYFENEELSVRELHAAIDLYCEIRPKIMLTHEAPRSIIGKFTDSSILRKFGFDPEWFTTRTSEALQIMFEEHKPEQWYFGHYHRSWSGEVDGCEFTCINEHCFVDVEVEL